MRTISITACLLLMGCASYPSDSNRVSSRLAERGTSTNNVRVIEDSVDTAYYKILAKDGRRWRIPTHYYVPSKVVYEAPMRENCEVYQVHSERNEIIGLQENCGGEWISRRLLFIDGDRAKLFEIVDVERSGSGLRDGEPDFLYTWPIEAISESGVVLKGVFFPWRALKCNFVDEYQAEQDVSPNA